MPSPSLSPEETLRQLRENAQALARVIEGISPEVAAMRHRPGEWSMAEVLGHLLICEEFAHARLVRMVHETDPYLPAFDDHRLLELRGYGSTPAAELLATFQAFARENLALLEGLSPEQWQRGGRHEERGPITIHYIAAEMLAKHHQEHLAQIHDIRKALETGSP